MCACACVCVTQHLEKLEKLNKNLICLHSSITNTWQLLSARFNKDTVSGEAHWGFLFLHFTPAGAGENRLFSRHCRNGGMCTEAFVAVSYGNSNQLMKIWHIWTGSLERVVGKLLFGIRYSYVFFIFRNICISEMYAVSQLVYFGCTNTKV